MLLDCLYGNRNNYATSRSDSKVGDFGRKAFLDSAAYRSHSIKAIRIWNCPKKTIDRGRMRSILLVASGEASTLSSEENRREKVEKAPSGVFLYVCNRVSCSAWKTASCQMTRQHPKRKTDKKGWKAISKKVLTDGEKPLKFSPAERNAKKRKAKQRTLNQKAVL